MSKKPRNRKYQLFPRTLSETLKEAMQPLMEKEGKLYSALLQDWEKIVGTERAAISRPQRLQFSSQSAQGATLHLNVRPSAAPELAYCLEQMVEQCARHFGYRAITRIVLHPTHSTFEEVPSPTPSSPQHPPSLQNLPTDIAPEMQEILARMATHIASTVVKKD